MPKLTLYVMGRNVWRGEQEWPLARFPYALLSPQRWARQQPSRDRKPHRHHATAPRKVYACRPVCLRYPADPVPSRGGPICCTGDPHADGSYDQSAVEARDDVLVYSTPALKEGVEVTGTLEAVLYVSSATKDTDFTAKLVDVYPDGSAFNVQEGILRARYREGFTKKVWMKAGEVYEIPVDLEATSNYFGPGHRIRVEISSSNFPRFDRNLNTGGKNWLTRPSGSSRRTRSSIRKLHRPTSFSR